MVEIDQPTNNCELTDTAPPGLPSQPIQELMSASGSQKALEALLPWMQSVVCFDELALLLLPCSFLPQAGIFRTKSRAIFLEQAESITWSTGRAFVCSLESLAAESPRLAAQLQHQGVRWCQIAPIASAKRCFGFLLLGSKNDVEPSGEALAWIATLASVFAIALERALDLEERNCRFPPTHIGDDKKLKIVQHVTEAVVAELDMKKLLYKVAESVRNVLHIEYCDLLLFNPEKSMMSRLAVSYEDGDLMSENFDEPMCKSPAHRAFLLRKPVVCTRREMVDLGKEVEAMRLLLAEGIQETCSVPLISQGKTLGVFNACSTKTGTFVTEWVSLLMEIAKPIAVAVNNALTYKELLELKDKLACEKESLEGVLRSSSRQDEIVGESKALRAVLDQVALVADSEANVLILGETGTGKELIARTLYSLGRRKSRAFVKLNCAAIPAGLLETELFGHEKGAFTGAIANKMGMIEIANRGTLFLDEVGDLPLELQPKLLRVLQEQQFSRVGSTRTIQVDIQIISATNRDLPKMVAEEKFRSDLFYRLNVVPIHVPPLRERREDIPSLVHYFVQKFSRIRRRAVDTVPDCVMTALKQWTWPGNIRELENFMERAVVMSRGRELNVPLHELVVNNSSPKADLEPISPPSLLQLPLTEYERAQREQILGALARTNGIISGPRGAAKLLGLKRTTLASKMQRLGIINRRVQL
ncbi:MAG: sigma 54-interacting transcriptional regulator [Acidobacteriota bacterium]|nr:sigma 54-interacting transcriptional regulator [Acidobacteriota bacterium]